MASTNTMIGLRPRKRYRVRAVHAKNATIIDRTIERCMGQNHGGRGHDLIARLCGGDNHPVDREEPYDAEQQGEDSGAGAARDLAGVGSAAGRCRAALLPCDTARGFSTHFIRTTRYFRDSPISACRSPFPASAMAAPPLPHRRHRQPTRFTQAHRAYVGARVSTNRLYHRTVVLADVDADASVPAAEPAVRQPMDAFGVSLANPACLDRIEDRPFQRTGLLPTEVVAGSARRERFSQ